MSFLKRIAAWLPASWQSELKRIYFRNQIRHGTFITEEPEFALLAEFVSDGDWVVDVGANIGHYTKRLSELVGCTGRVIAIEPVPETFLLLTANLQYIRHDNITLLNAAAAENSGVAGMTIPTFSTGLKNFYQAHLVSEEDAELRVLTLSLDSICLCERQIALVKIDAEGHEAGVLRGMKEILRRDRPVMIVETFSEEVIDQMRTVGYSCERLPGSSNVIFRYTLSE
ncbi:MAG: FkbM family methyltransferase [Candidatus Competibacter sp.]|nr:FkbM family methyltransferase [Candidatus Competibacter sp.]